MCIESGFPQFSAVWFQHVSWLQCNWAIIGTLRRVSAAGEGGGGESRDSVCNMRARATARVR